MADSEYDYAAEHSLALQTIHAASRLTKQVLRGVSSSNEKDNDDSEDNNNNDDKTTTKTVSAETKADDSPVTVADFAAQALIISALHAAYPDDSFLGEESAAQLRSNDDLATSVWDLVQHQSARSGDVQHVPRTTTTAPEANVNVRLTLPTSKQQMLDLIDLGTSAHTQSGRVWVMDPVDGTATFMTGNQYAVCLCLLVEGVQKLAVIGCPNLAYHDVDVDVDADTDAGSPRRPRQPPPMLHEDLVDTDGYGVVLSAIDGRGTHLRKMYADSLGDPKRIQHAHRNAPQDPTTLNFIETTLGKTSLSQDEHKRVADVLGAKWPGTVLWSQQMKYVALTLGATDVMLRLPKGRDRYTAVWDHAGGALLFQEAGGIIRDLDGGEIDFGQGRLLRGERNFGMVAALPGIWDAVHRAVTCVLQQRAK